MPLIRPEDGRTLPIRQDHRAGAGGALPGGQGAAQPPRPRRPRTPAPPHPGTPAPRHPPRTPKTRTPCPQSRHVAPEPAHRPPGQPGSSPCSGTVRDLHLAATEPGIDLRTVRARARTDTRPAIALAGRDPDVPRGTRPHPARRLPCAPTTFAWPSASRGLSPGRASGAGPGGETIPTFAAACNAVSAASPPCGAGRVIRLTPQRVARFLKELSKPGTPVIAAAAAIGVSSAAICRLPSAGWRVCLPPLKRRFYPAPTAESSPELAERDPAARIGRT